MASTIQEKLKLALQSNNSGDLEEGRVAQFLLNAGVTLVGFQRIETDTVTVNPIGDVDIETEKASMEPVALILTVEITPADFASFLQTLAAKPDFDGLYNGVITSNDACVWLKFGPEDVAVEDFTAFAQAFGSEPKTYILLDVCRGDASERLAVEVACKFAERWPVVLDNLLTKEDGGKIFSREELFELKANNKSFWPRYAAVASFDKKAY